MFFAIAIATISKSMGSDIGYLNVVLKMFNIMIFISDHNYLYLANVFHFSCKR